MDYSSNILDAKLLKNNYPIETQDFSVMEVKQIWGDYSDSFSAGWLWPTNNAEVMQVFNKHRGV